jgi:hypothetical protein
MQYTYCGTLQRNNYCSTLQQNVCCSKPLFRDARRGCTERLLHCNWPRMAADASLLRAGRRRGRRASTRRACIRMFVDAEAGAGGPRIRVHARPYGRARCAPTPASEHARRALARGGTRASAGPARHEGQLGSANRLASLGAGEPASTGPYRPCSTPRQAMPSGPPESPRSSMGGETGEASGRPVRTRSTASVRRPPASERRRKGGGHLGPRPGMTQGNMRESSAAWGKGRGKRGGLRVIIGSMRGEEHARQQRRLPTHARCRPRTRTHARTPTHTRPRTFKRSHTRARSPPRAQQGRRPRISRVAAAWPAPGSGPARPTRAARRSLHGRLRHHAALLTCACARIGARVVGRGLRRRGNASEVDAPARRRGPGEVPPPATWEGCEWRGDAGRDA